MSYILINCSFFILLYLWRFQIFFRSICANLSYAQRDDETRTIGEKFRSDQKHACNRLNDEERLNNDSIQPHVALIASLFLNSVLAIYPYLSYLRRLCSRTFGSNTVKVRSRKESPDLDLGEVSRLEVGMDRWQTGDDGSFLVCSDTVRQILAHISVKFRWSMAGNNLLPASNVVVVVVVLIKGDASDVGHAKGSTTEKNRFGRFLRFFRRRNFFLQVLPRW